MTVDSTISLPNTGAGKAVDASSSITTLAQGSMFWRPSYLRQSDWLEHIPFAFWLVEALKPSCIVELGAKECASYFAMCQAVNRLHIDACCFAISPWNSLVSTSGSTEDIYDLVKDHNDSHYSSFSSLVRSTSEEALEHFSDQSIDLIHFDGLSGCEEAKLLIDSWKPKLSDGGLILIHDTNVRKKGMQVHRLFKDLSESYPSFEFRHGQGLGVLGVGVNQTEMIQVLFEDSKNRGRTQVVQDVFSRLGRACADSYTTRSQVQNAMKLEEEARELKRDLETAEKGSLESRRELDQKYIELEELQQRVSQQVEANALERGQVVERSSMIQSLYDELKIDATKLRTNLEEASSLLSHQTEKLSRTEIENKKISKQILSLEEEHKATMAAQARMEQETVSHQESMQRLQARFDSVVEEAASVSSELDQSISCHRTDEKRLLLEIKDAKEEAASATKEFKESIGRHKTNEKLLLVEINVANEKAALAKNELEESITRHRTGEKLMLLEIKDAQDEEKRMLLEVKNAQDEEKRMLLEVKTAKEDAVDFQISLTEVTSQMDAEKRALWLELSAARQETIKCQQNLAKIADETEMEIAARDLQMQKKDESIRSLGKSIDELRESVALRYGELSVLTKHVETREGEHKKGLKNELASLAMEYSNQLIQVRTRLSHLQQGRAAELFGRKETKEQVNLVEASDLFDARWYLAQYPDVAANAKAAKRPAWHFVVNGCYEGRSPSAEFDTVWYLKKNADVAKMGGNPLVHYLLHGNSEGRLPKQPSE